MTKRILPLPKKPRRYEHSELLAIKMQIGLDAELRSRGTSDVRLMNIVIAVVIKRAYSCHARSLFAQGQFAKLQGSFFIERKTLSRYLFIHVRLLFSKNVQKFARDQKS